jgi:hypothetical protein
MTKIVYKCLPPEKAKELLRLKGEVKPTPVKPIQDEKALYQGFINQIEKTLAATTLSPCNRRALERKLENYRQLLTS